MRNLRFVLAIVLSAALAGGCQNQPLGSSSAPADNSHLQEDRSGSLQANDRQQFSLTPSDKIEGWQELRAKVFLNEMTYYGDRSGSQQMAGGRMVDYSLHLPGSWILEDTVFYKDNRKKIAELFSVVLLKADEESRFLDFKVPGEDTEVELLSKEKVMFHEYRGVKIVLKVTAKETWYPHHYYLTDGTYGFMISFYSYSEKRDETEQKLFDDIVSTFRFETEAES